MLINKLRLKIIPLYLAVFATLLPAFIQVAQAVPARLSAGTGFVVICTGQGIVTVPTGDEPARRHSGGSVDCAICLSLSISNHTLTPATLALAPLRQMRNSILIKRNAIAANNDISLRYQTRAPPVEFNS